MSAACCADGVRPVLERLIQSMFSSATSSLRPRREFAVENLALRHQIASSCELAAINRLLEHEADQSEKGPEEEGMRKRGCSAEVLSESPPPRDGPLPGLWGP